MKVRSYYFLDQTLLECFPGVASIAYCVGIVEKRHKMSDSKSLDHISGECCTTQVPASSWSLLSSGLTIVRSISDRLTGWCSREELTAADDNLTPSVGRLGSSESTVMSRL